jgi:hypothetical protein
MRYNNTRSWNYTRHFKPKRDLIDPRIAIARHIGWHRGTAPDTEHSVPEPDNYNRAIFANKPVDCEFIEDQVFYFDKQRLNWFSIYYVPDEQVEEFNLWVEKIEPTALWQHLNAPKIRPQRSLLWCRDNKSSRTLTDNERLHTMGYYEELKVKYFNDDTAYVDSLLGEARALLENFVPEEQSDADDCNNSSVC